MSKAQDSFELLANEPDQRPPPDRAGPAQYQHLLDEADASVLDDIIVWWVAEERFDVMPNASNTERVIRSLGGHGRDRRAGCHCRAGTASARTTRDRRARCRRGRAFRAADFEFEGVDVESPVPATPVRTVWSVPCRRRWPPPSGGRSSAPGCSRQVLERVTRFASNRAPSARRTSSVPDITPLQAGLGWVVSWDKGPFRGREASERERTAGPRRRLRGLLAEGRRPPRSGDEVLVDGEVVSSTSGNDSPVLQRGIALVSCLPGRPRVPMSTSRLREGESRRSSSSRRSSG